MQLEVQTVSDSELPEGRHWLIVERQNGPDLLLISGDPARCWAFMQAHQGRVESCAMATTLIPDRHLTAV